MSEEKKSDAVKEVLEKTHDQVDLADESKRIRLAREHAGFMWWISATFGQLNVDHFRAIIDGKNLMLAKKRSKD